MSKAQLIIQVRLIERVDVRPGNGKGRGKGKGYKIEKTLDRRDIKVVGTIDEGTQALDWYENPDIEAEYEAMQQAGEGYDPERDDFDHPTDTPPDYEGDPERDRDEERYNAQLLREE